jgi:hypothetical protein
MASDVEKEFSIAPAMCQLALWRAAKWNPAKNKRPSIVGELLLAVLSLLVDEADGLYLLESKLCDTDRWQRGPERRKRCVPGGREPRARAFDDPCQCLLEVFQKCSKSLRN